MERPFETQMEKLKTRILKMSSLVDEQVDLAIKAVENEDIELADFVIGRDTKVDKHDIKIDKLCQRIFALNQPVANDLRFLMSALTINNNLERIGDIAVNIAEGIKILKKKPAYFERTRFKEMSVLVKEMVKSAIDSFIQNDPKLSAAVIEQDDMLDKHNSENHAIIIEIMKESAENIEPGVSMLVICRQLERMGDHATNIAEDVYFIVEGEVIKHKYEKYFPYEDEED